MNTKLHGGFKYLIEVLKDGVVVDSEEVYNLMPTEGVNHMLGVTLVGASQVTTWYAGLYEGNYTPVIGDTAALLPSLAVECTTYVGTTRKTWTPGSVAAGVVDNSAARAEFEFNATKTVYGGFLSSAPAKGATTGVLISVVRFSSPRVLDSGSILRVTAGMTLTST
jgi:hypothetical protein